MNTSPRYRIALYAVVAILLILSAASYAQAPYYYTVRPQGHGMRNAALAEASSADPSDVTSMFWNPGILSFLKDQSIVATHSVDLRTRTNSEHVAGSFMVYRGLTLAASGSVSHGGKLEPENGPVVDLKGYGADVAGSYALMPTLSLGGLFGIRNTDFGGTTVNYAWAHVGVFYYPSPGISYGMAYRMTRGHTYWYANLQSGVIREPDLLQNLEIGATMMYPSLAERPVVILALTTEKSFPGVSLFSTKGGLEVLPTRFLALRIGFKVGTLERVARYGIGLQFERFELDFAAGPSRAENRFSGVSLTVKL